MGGKLVKLDVRQEYGGRAEIDDPQTRKGSNVDDNDEAIGDFFMDRTKEMPSESGIREKRAQSADNEDETMAALALARRLTAPSAIGVLEGRR